MRVFIQFIAAISITMFYGGLEFAIVNASTIGTPGKFVLSSFIFLAWGVVVSLVKEI